MGLSYNEIRQFAVENGADISKTATSANLKRTDSTDGSTARAVLSVRPATLDVDDMAAAAVKGSIQLAGTKGNASERGTVLSGAAAGSVVRSIMDKGQTSLAVKGKGTKGTKTPEALADRGNNVPVGNNGAK